MAAYRWAKFLGTLLRYFKLLMRKTPNRLPDFLIVGAMKSATTGLFMDLCQHPQMFFTNTKEPHCLCEDRVLTEEGLREYAQHYDSAKADQFVCDASTSYSKLPDYDGVVSRAQKVLPEGFKVIYMVRHPIKRIASQYHHELQAGLVGKDIDEVVRANPRFVNYSRYGYQLRPWIEAIGLDRVHVVRFEDYKKNRQEVVQSVCEFLGLPTKNLPSLSTEVYNQSAGKPVAGQFWKFFSSLWFYRQCLRPLVSLKFRLTLQRLMFRKSDQEPVQLADETVAWLNSQLQEDRKQFEDLVKVKKPLWPS